jgi:hypothetical protein
MTAGAAAAFRFPALGLRPGPAVGDSPSTAATEPAAAIQSVAIAPRALASDCWEGPGMVTAAAPSNVGRHVVGPAPASPGAGPSPVEDGLCLPGLEETPCPTVIVVGAGVSGCACAAALATAGVRVTLMNSAMDRVGLPAYGPDLLGGDAGWGLLKQALEALPRPLRNVWVRAASMPASKEAIVNIDRRMVSIETKRALERIPGLEFRQGFVTDVRLVDGSTCAATSSAGELDIPDGGPITATPKRLRAEVETIFGEAFRADAVVVAVGLSLGGQVLVGGSDDAVPGGRYGEPASEGLRAALETLGAGFREVPLQVGPRVSARTAYERGWLPPELGDGVEAEARADAGGSVPEDASVEPLVPIDCPAVASRDCRDTWPAEYPPAPHCQPDLRIVDRMILSAGHSELQGRGQTVRAPVLSPDGVALGEVYLGSGSLFASEAAGASSGPEDVIASRASLLITGMAVTNTSDTGRMRRDGELLPLWVIGRSAGAPDYATGLFSGVTAAEDIVRFLRGSADKNPPPGQRPEPGDAP